LAAGFAAQPLLPVGEAKARHVPAAAAGAGRRRLDSLRNRAGAVGAFAQNLGPIRNDKPLSCCQPFQCGRQQAKRFGIRLPPRIMPC
jgi:hypothetical protein